MNVRTAISHAAKHLGAFSAASRATSGSLSILGYHGFSLGDEHRFRPGLFLRPEQFEKRLKFLRSEGFRVLPLDDAIGLLQQGALRRKDVAITIDDGFHGTAEVALPLLRRYRYPATIYVTTYYVVRNHPIFRLVLQYCFWRGTGQTLALDGLWPECRGTVTLGSPKSERALWALIRRGEWCGDESERVHVSREVARRVGVDYEELARSRRFTLMRGEQIADAAASGAGIELHTHRHRLPLDKVQLHREIAENRSVLEPLVGRRLRHLCYPSNVGSRAQWSALRKAGVETAATCEPGMNSRNVELLGLRRFLDDNTIPQVLFEAELSGLGDIWRQWSRPAKPIRKPGAMPQVAPQSAPPVPALRPGSTVVASALATTDARDASSTR